MTHNQKLENHNIYDGYGHRLIRQIQKAAEIQTVVNLWTPKNHSESEQGKQKIYNGFGHRDTKQIQKTVQIQATINLWAPKKTRNQNRENKEIYDGYDH